MATTTPVSHASVVSTSGVSSSSSSASASSQKKIMHVAIVGPDVEDAKRWSHSVMIKALERVQALMETWGESPANMVLHTTATGFANQVAVQFFLHANVEELYHKEGEDYYPGYAGLCVHLPAACQWDPKTGAFKNNNNNVVKQEASSNSVPMDDATYLNVMHRTNALVIKRNTANDLVTSHLIGAHFKPHPNNVVVDMLAGCDVVVAISSTDTPPATAHKRCPMVAWKAWKDSCKANPQIASAKKYFLPLAWLQDGSQVLSTRLPFLIP